MNLIELQNITMKFGDKVVLNHLSLDVKEQELLAITGASGSGKSTILNILGLLLQPTSGDRIHFGERNVRINSEKAIKMLRHHIGYLFQNYALIDNLTAMDNMKIAIKYSDVKNKPQVIREALAKVGLQQVTDQKVYTLSGGEQQRLSIARLLVKPCEVVLADEPTGNLDMTNAENIMSLFHLLVERGKTVVMVTHDANLLGHFHRTIRLEHNETK